MATYCSIFAWRTPWPEKPGGLLSMGLQRVDATEQHWQTKIPCNHVPCHILFYKTLNPSPPTKYVFPSTKIDAVFTSGPNSILDTSKTFRQTIASVSILGGTNKQKEKQNGSIWGKKYGSFFFFFPLEWNCPHNIEEKKL